MEGALEADYAVTLDEYHTFVETRPEDERWELVDGELVLNPSPTNWHQLIVRNVVIELDGIARTTKAHWIVIPGIGTRRPQDETNEPVPDVMVIPKRSDGPTNWTSDVTVAFEVLSRWSARRDMVHKREFYAMLEPLTDYVVLAQDRMEAHVFSRANDFEPVVLGADDTLTLASLAVSVPLRDLYRDVSID